MANSCLRVAIEERLSSERLRRYAGVWIRYQNHDGEQLRGRVDEDVSGVGEWLRFYNAN